MQPLVRTLQDHDLGHLRVVSELWGFDPPSGTAPLAARELAARMLEPAALSDMLASLPGNARQVLHALAAQGHPALVLSAHVSNLDVPALYSLLKRRGEEALFEDIVFIAGRKLTEGCKSIKSMAEMFSRVVISAKSSKMNEQESARSRFGLMSGCSRSTPLSSTPTRTRKCGT